MSGLQPQNFPVPIGGGIDTKTDPRKVAPGKVITLQNGQFQIPGRVSKRNGSTHLSSTILGGGSIGVGKAAATYNSELLRFDGSNVYALSEALLTNINRGVVTGITTTQTPIIRTNLSQVCPDLAVIGDFQVYSYMEELFAIDTVSRGAFFNIRDSITGAFLVSKVALPGDWYPRVLKFQNIAYFFSITPFTVGTKGTLHGSFLDPATPLASLTSADIATHDVQNHWSGWDGAGNGEGRGQFYNVAVSGDGSQVVFAYVVPTGITVGLMNPDLSVSSSPAPVTIPIYPGGTLQAINCIEVFVDPVSHEIFVFATIFGTSPDANGVEYFVLNPDLTTKLAPTDIDITFGQLQAGAVISVQVQAGQVTIYYEDVGNFATATAASATRYETIHTAVVDDTGIVTPPSVFQYGAAIQSKACVFQGQSYFLAGYTSFTQATYFILRGDQIICGKILPGQAAVHSNLYTLGHLLVNGTKAELSVQVLFEESGGTTPPSPQLYGISHCGIDFDDMDHSFISSKLDKDLTISGSTVLIYDGNRIVEQGFYLFPETPTAVINAGSGMTPGSYQYVVVFEYLDNNGQITESAVSVPLQVSVPGSTTSVTLTIDSLKITQKKGAKDVRMSVYSTPADGSEFFKINNYSPSGAFYNDPSVHTQAVTDGGTANAQNTPVLYTTGGLLDNDQAPSCSSMSIFDNRIFCFGLEDQDSIGFSKSRADGVPASFSDVFRVSVDPKGGPVTAGARIDEKLIIFKKDTAFVMFGSGPNDLGQNSSYSVPAEIVSPVGCAYPKSIAVLPENPSGPGGIIFKSDKGIWCLDRTLTFKYIGADVESYALNADITSAVVLDELNQVRFVLDSGVELQYDYFMNQWSVFTIPAVSATNYQDLYTSLSSSGVASQERSGLFTDNLIAISLSLGTSWIKTTDIQNYQRIWALWIVGDWKSPHQLNVDLYYDYSPVKFATKVIDASSPPSDGVYQWRIHLPQQKCESIRFVVYDTFPGLAPGEGFDLTQMSLEVAVKTGLFKLPPGKTKG